MQLLVNDDYNTLFSMQYTPFSLQSDPGLYNEQKDGTNQVNTCVEVGSNSSTIALKFVGGTKNEPVHWGYNWATLFLGG
jgi:hypothetical protein